MRPATLPIARASATGATGPIGALAARFRVRHTG